MLRRVVLPLFTLAVILASLTLPEAAGAAQTLGPPPAPTSVRAVANPAAGGTDVYWTPASTAGLKVPTSFKITSCGPYSLTGTSLTTALTKKCKGEASAVTVSAPASATSALAKCHPTTTLFCVIVVTSAAASTLSAPSSPIGAGGNVPNPVTNLTAQPTSSAAGLNLTWTAGADVTQPSGAPAEPVSYEIRRNGTVIAQAVTATTYVDSGCPAATACTESVTATNAGGRANAVSTVGVTRGSTAPKVQATGSVLLVPGVGSLSGTLGSGKGDPRPVQVRLTPTSSPRGAAPSAQLFTATSSGAGWTATIPPSTPPGTYTAVAMQLGNTSTSTPVYIAVPTQLSVTVGGATSNRIGAVSGMNALVAGQGTSSAPASNVGVQEVAVNASPGTSPTQSALATAFSRATTVLSSVTADVGADGTWSVPLPEYNSRGNFHILKVTQTVPGQSAGTTYIAFSVAADGAPSAPTITSTQRADGGASISWSTPNANGSPISSYLVTASPGGAQCFASPTGQGDSNSCTITGLTNGTPYTFTVVASNGFGPGLASQPSSSVVPAGPPNAPGTPTATLLTGNQSGKATVTWSAPASSGEPVTSYVAQAVENPQITCTVQSPTSGTNQCTVQGLTAGTNYHFTVTASNLLGTGTPSLPSTGVMLTDVPSAPTAVTAAPLDQSARVSWIPGPTNGAPITSYAVRSVTSNTILCTYNVPLSGPEIDSCLVTGLTNGTSYAFTVTATSQIGTSPKSTASYPVIPVPVPSAPQNLQASPSGGAGLTVTWDAPLTGAAYITGYRVSVGDLTCTPSPATARRCVLNGLNAGETYNVLVTATDNAGTSPAASLSVTLRTAPGTPRSFNLGALTSDGRAPFSWLPPLSDGGATITSYTVIAKLPGNFTAGTCTYTVPENAPESDSCTIAGLQIGNPYTFSVVATNAVGSSSAATSGQAVVGTPAQPSIPYVLIDGTTATIALALNQWAAIPATGASFTVRSSPGAFTCHAAPPSDMPWGGATCSISNLIPGTTYTFTTTATNGVATSVTSDPSSPVTASAPPAPDSNVTTSWTTSIWPGAQAMVISWAPGELNGSVLDHYEATLAPGLTCTTSTENYCTIDPVTKGGGLLTPTVITWWKSDSSPSATEGSTDPATGTSFVNPDRPWPVAQPSVIAGAQRVAVSWSPPSNNGGGDITSYDVTGFYRDDIGNPHQFAACTYDVPTSGPETDTCTATGLTNGRTYWFWVTATNAGGTSQADTYFGAAGPISPAGPPSSPTNVLLVTGAVVGSSRIAVNWTASDNAGSPDAVVTYLATAYDPQGNPSGTCTATGQYFDGCVISGLTNGVAYTAVVVASSGAGSSDPSTPSAPAMATGPPQEPTGVHATAGDQSVTVAWTAPAVTGGLPITSYNVYTVSGYPTNGTCHSAGTSCTISGLINGVAYMFMVIATNDSGSSGASQSSTPVTPGAPPPAATDAAAFPLDGQAWVSWSAGVSSDPGTSATSFTATADPGGRSCTTAQHSCFITGLTDALTYTVTVVAQNDAGSAPGTSAGTVTPQGPPSPPTSVSATAGAASATVTWWAGADNGSPVNRFFATAYDLSGAPAGQCSTEPESDTPFNSCVISGLINGMSYRIEVTAQNGVGTSDPSAVNAVTPVDVPTAPGWVTATAGIRSARVSWTPSSAQGTPVTGYTVTASPGGATCTTSSTSCTLNDLVGSQAYNFTVQATSGVGLSLGAQTSLAAVMDVPLPAATVSVVAADRSITATWTPAAIQGSAVATYRAAAILASTMAVLTPEQVTQNAAGLMASAAGSCSVAEPLDGDTVDTCTIPGLQNGTSYVVLVAATSPAGTGAPGISTPSTPAGVPSSPTLISAVPSSNAVTLTWLPSIAAGTPLTGYLASSTDGSTPCSVPPGAPGQALSCTISGFTTGSTVSVSVVATSAAGSSSPSTVSGVVISPVPSAPTGVGVTELPGVGQLQVSGEAPSVGTGVSSYLVAVYPSAAYSAAAGDPTALAALLASPSSFCSVLPKAGGGFSCQLAAAINRSWTVITWAINQSGQGDGSPPVVIATGHPYAPTSATVIQASQTSATVFWGVSPSVSGAPVTSYLVNASPSGKSCTATAAANALAGSCTLTQLPTGSTQTITVTALNAVGSSSPTAASAFTLQSAANPPTALSAKATGANSLQFKWTAPTGGTLPLLSYSVVATSPGLAAKSCSTASVGGAAPATTCTITGLISGSTWSAYVTATNSQGASSPSAPAQATTVTGAPSAPTGVTATAWAGQAVVSWATPNPAPSPAVTSYTVVASQDTTKSCTPSPTTATSCTVRGLTNGTSYTFVVTATNTTGTSLSASAPTVIPLDVPGAPLAPVATALDGSASISWAAPSANGSAITSFAVVASQDATKSCTPSPATATSCTVRGLTNGTSYTFVVTATNAQGTSLPSGPTSSVTPRGAPGVVSSPAVTIGSSSINVTWAPPSDRNGALLSRYQVTTSPPSSGCTIQVTGTESDVCSITGLTNGLTYKVWIQAFSPTGNSPILLAGTVIPVGPPDQPDAPSVQTGDGSAWVSWTSVGSSEGLAVTSETAAILGDSTHSCSVTPPSNGGPIGCTITGLTNGTTYQVVLTMTTSRGTSPASTPVSTSPVGAPAAATFTSVTPQDGAATLVWTQGVTNGSIPQLYQAWALEDPSKSCAVDATRTTHTCTITGLRNGVTYHFAVATYFQLGLHGMSLWGATSSISDGVMPLGLPLLDATSIATKIAPESITLSWAPAGANGASVTRYDVVAVVANPVSSNPSDGWTYSLLGDSAPHCSLTSADQLLSPQCTFTELTDGVHYAFVITATNAAGTRQLTTVPAMPMAPPSTPSISGTYGDGTSVTIAIAGGSANGAPQTFTVTAVENPNAVCQDTPSGSDTFGACTITGLTPGQAYSFTVVATNQVGASPSSDPSAPVTIETAPSPPTDVGASSDGVGTLTVNWTPGSANGSPITSYTATAVPWSYTQDSPSSPTSFGFHCTTSATSCSITGMPLSSTYVFTVQATNSIGTSPSSMASWPITVTGAPNAPSITLVQAGIGQATLWWSPAKENGVRVASYQVTAAEDPTKTCTPSPADSTTCTITGLTTAHSWTFTVVATDTSGDASGASGPSSPVMTGTAPSAPRNVTATLVTDGRCTSATCVQVSWTPAEANGAPITSFTATDVSSIVPFSCVYNVPGSGPETDSCLISNINGGSRIDAFSVTASNAIGTSTSAWGWGNVAPVPATPTIGEVDPGATSATVWLDGVGASTDTLNVQVADDPTRGCQQTITRFTTTFGCTVAGLIPGRRYTFVVNAGNVAGWSAASAPSTPVTIGRIPGPPTNLVAQSAPGLSSTSASLAASWSPPADDGGAAPTSYVIRVRNAWTGELLVNSCTDNIDPTSPVYSCTITGLNWGSHYVIFGSTTTGVGTSTFSATSDAVTLLPSEPTIESPVQNLQTAAAQITLSGHALSSSDPVTLDIRAGTSPTGLLSSTVTVLPGSDGSYSATMPTPSVDGHYTAWVRQDPGGTSDQWATPLPFIRDTTAPALRLSIDQTMSSQQFCGTAGTSSGDLAQITVTGTSGERVFSTQVTPGSGGSFCFSPAGDGLWNVSALQSDQAGNQAAVTATGLLDTTAPGPVLTLPSQGSDAPQWAYQLTGMAGTSLGDASTVQIGLTRIDCTTSCGGTLIGTVDSLGTWSAAVSSLGAGTWAVVSVSQADRAGNVGTATYDSTQNAAQFVVETTAPPRAVLSGGGQTPVVVTNCSASSAVHPYSSTLSIWQGNSTSGAPWKTFDVGTPSQCTSPASTTMTFNLGTTDPTLLPTGIYSIQVATSDPSGARTLSSVMRDVVVADPSTTVRGLVLSGADPTASAVLAPGLSVTGTAIAPGLAGAGATVTLSFAPQGSPSWFSGSSSPYSAQVTILVADDGSYSYGLPSTFPDGTYLVSATEQTPGGLATTQGGPVSLTVLAPSGTLNPAQTTVAASTSSSSATVGFHGGLPALRTVTAASMSVQGSTATPCTATLTKGAQSLVPTGWGCSVTGVFGNAVVNLALSTSYVVTWTSCTTATTTFDASCSATGGTETSVSTLQQGIVTTMPAPQIASPAPSVLNADGSIADASTPLGNTITVSGTGSTDGVDATSVTVYAFNRSSGALGWCNCLGTTSVPLIANKQFFTSWTTLATAKQTLSLSNGAFSGTMTLANGTYDLVTTQSDSAGQLGASSVVTIVVNSAGPTITQTWPPAGTTEPSAFLGLSIANGWGAGSTQTPQATVSYYAGNTASGTPAVVATIGGCQGCSTRIGDAQSTLGNGTWTAVVTATSHSGASTTSTFHFTVDQAHATAQPTSLRIASETGGPLDTSPLAGTGFVSVVASSGSQTPDTPTPSGQVQLTITAPGDADQVSVMPLINGVASFQVSYHVTWPRSPHLTAVLLPGAGYATSSVERDVAPRYPTDVALAVAPSFPNGIFQTGSLLIRETFVGPHGIIESCSPDSMRVWVESPLHFPLTTGTLTQQLDASGNPTGTLVLSGVAAPWQRGTNTLAISVDSDEICGQKTEMGRALTDFGAEPFAVDTFEINYVDGTRTQGSTSTYSVGQTVPISIHVLNAGAGVPVWALDATGATEGSPVYTDASGSATVAWIPDATGAAITPTVRVGAQGGAVARSTVARSLDAVPVEQAPVAMSMAFSPNADIPVGGAATGTLSISGLPRTGSTSQLTQGVVTLWDAKSSRDTAVNWPITCATTCTATGTVPSSLFNEAGPLTLRATYTSAASGLTYQLDSTVPRLAQDPTTTTLSVGQSPADQIAAGTVTVTWTPSPAATTTTTYTATARADGSSLASGTCTTTQNSCVISGLNPAVTYSYFVSAAAADGTALSAPMGLTTTTRALSAGTSTRDQMVPVTATFTPSSAEALQIARSSNVGVLIIDGQPSICTPTPSYLNADWCRRMHSSLQVNVRTGAVSVLSTPLMPSGGADSRFTSSAGATWSNGSLVVAASMLLGQGTFQFSATYAPGSSGWTPLAASRAAAISLTGVGDIPMTFKTGHALASGGYCNNPDGTPIHATGDPSIDCTYSDISSLSPVDATSGATAMVGQTAYVVAQCDPTLCSPVDLATPWALAEGTNSDASFISSPTNQLFTDSGMITYAAGGSLSDQAHLQVPGTETKGSSQDCNAISWGWGDANGVHCSLGIYPTKDSYGPYTCTECVIWPISNLGDSDPYADGGGLGAGMFELSAIPYSVGADITAPTITMGSTQDQTLRSSDVGGYQFPLTVSSYTMSTTVHASVLQGMNLPDPTSNSGLSYTACTTSCSQYVEVLVDNSVPNMPADVAGPNVNGLQAFDPTKAEVQIFMTPARAGADPQLIADCTGGGLCTTTTVTAINDQNYTAQLQALPKSSATPMGNQLEIQIPFDGSASLIGASLEAVVSSPWTEDATGSTVTLGASSAASIGPASLSVAGQHTGTSLQVPDISPPAGAFTWDQYEGEMSFFSSLFGSSAASTLTEITDQLVQMVIGSMFTGPLEGELAAGLGALTKALGGGEEGLLSALGTKVSNYVAKSPRLTKAVATVVNSDAVVAVRTFIAKLARPAANPGKISRLFTRAKNWSKGLASKMTIAEDSAVGQYLLKAGCKAGAAAFRVGRTDKIDAPMIVFNDPCGSLKTQAALLAQSQVMGVNGTGWQDSTFGQVVSWGMAIKNWQASWQQALAALIASQPARKPGDLPSDDVGLGVGVAQQFTQFFDAVVSVQTPTWTATSASTITIDLMDEQHYRFGATASKVATLVTCNGASYVCSGENTVSVTPIDGQLLINGYFPPDVAWLPPGAWLRVTVSTPGQSNQVAYADIAFPGHSIFQWNNATNYFALSPAVPANTFASKDPFAYLVGTVAWKFKEDVDNLMYDTCMAEQHANLKWTATTECTYDPSSNDNGGTGWPG